MNTDTRIKSNLEIVPFYKDHLEAAAALVAARYRAERRKNELINRHFENPGAILPHMNYSNNNPGSVAALQHGKVVGFLMAFPIVGRGLPAVWTPDWGHGAIARGRKDIYRTMYAAAAAAWVKDGRTVHALRVYAGESATISSWSSLGFGINGVDALLEIPEIIPESSSFDIRRAGPGDLETLLGFREAMARYFNGTAVFAYTTEDFLWQGNELFRQQLTDPEVAIWLACDNGRPVGCMKVVPSKHEGFHLPITGEETCSITMAYTEERYRKKGVATALLYKILSWAKERGYTRCSVDFDSANVLGSRFWLSHFRPVCYGLERRIDSRVLQYQNEGEKLT